MDEINERIKALETKLEIFQNNHEKFESFMNNDFRQLIASVLEEDRTRRMSLSQILGLVMGYQTVLFVGLGFILTAILK